MQFSATTVATIIAFTGLVSAAPATEKRAGTGVVGDVGAVWTDALPNQLMKLNVLWYNVYLPPAWSMTAWGQYGTCYNTPAPYAATTGSIDMAGGAPACWIFSGANCSGKTQEVKTGGIQVFESGVASINCDAPTTK